MAPLRDRFASNLRQRILLLCLVSLQTKNYGRLMAVMVPRESWTDKRLDDFRENVNQRFDRVDADIRELRRMMFQGFLVLVGIMVTGFLSLAGLVVF